ncbi:MAG: class I SAM-dependent methyltransferase [Nitrososphaerota archaeon]|jgi:SAM-dependent methyltransferase|nr:class I SAM-dependent methyltransferase [Nitrososphaerota archaeon]
MQTSNVFDKMGFFWAEIADKDQTQHQIQFLKSQLTPGGYMLDLACGSGRHINPLCEMGFNMTGLDSSPALLKIAQQRRTGLLVRGDMRFLPYKTGMFVAVVSMDTSFGYLSSETGDIQSLSEIRRVLRWGGVLIVDVFNRENLIRRYLGKRSLPKLLEYPDFFLHQHRTISSDGSRLCDRWEVHNRADREVRVFEHTVRLYTYNQLEWLFVEAGFEIKEVFGGYEGQKFSSETPRLIFLANAK